MKLYIYPKHMEEAAKPGWIVRTLRTLGVILGMPMPLATCFSILFLTKKR